MKKFGCVFLLALPAIAFFYSWASRLEQRSSKVVQMLKEKDTFRSTPTPATLAEARQMAQEDTRRMRARDTYAIEELLREHGERLERQAATQVAGRDASRVKCRAVRSTATEQTDSAAWWNLDFECFWPRDKLERAGLTTIYPPGLPSKTSVSLRLAKKPFGWTLD